MDFSKLKKISFILLILFIVLFPFWCVRGLCVEPETVDYTVVNNLTASPYSNAFAYSENIAVIYFYAEKGYIYHITVDNNQYTRACVVSSAVPAVSVPYNLLQRVTPNEHFEYDYYTYDDTYISVNGLDADKLTTVTRTKIPGMDSAVSDLVNNVGINSIWNIFDISINYIIVVVLFAFGCYIIFRIIRKISKGKEGL